MKQPLHGLAALLLLFTILPRHSHAQVKGDPVFPGVASGISISKSPSTLNPDLQRLAGTGGTTVTTQKTKIAAGIKPPPVIVPDDWNDYSQKVIQIRGSNVHRCHREGGRRGRDGRTSGGRRHYNGDIWPRDLGVH